MELISRYLQAVKFWLPKAKRHDIIAELSEDVHSQVEDHERELSRPLNKLELAAILKRRGQPILVAASYQQDGPMDPALWMIYRFVMKVVLLWVLTPILVITFVPAIFSAEHRAPALLWSLARSWQALVFATGMITIVFALVQKYAAARSLRLEQWDPLKLPAVRDAREISRFASICGLVFGALFTLWWMDLIRFPVLYSEAAAGLRIALAPISRGYYWAAMALSVACLIAHGANLWRPWWTRLRAGVWLALDCATGLMAYWLLQSGPLFVVTAASGSTAGRLPELSRLLNAGANILLWSTVVSVVLIVVFQDLRRLTQSDLDLPDVISATSAKT